MNLHATVLFMIEVKIEITIFTSGFIDKYKTSKNILKFVCERSKILNKSVYFD